MSNEAPRAVLSKREEVQPNKESWAQEIAWRAQYTSATPLDLALDEIARLHQALLIMREQRDKMEGKTNG